MSAKAIWTLTAEYRKPSRGDNGVIGTYGSLARAKRAFSDYLEEHWGRKPTTQELRECSACDGDELLDICQHDLED